MNMDKLKKKIHLGFQTKACQFALSQPSPFPPALTALLKQGTLLLMSAFLL